MSGERPSYALQKVIERAVAAAEACGLRTTGRSVRADGTVHLDVESITPARYVYFAQMERAWHVKIGIANHVGDRLATLQTSNPETLELLAAFPGTEHDEAQVHAALTRYRMRGEWFEFGPWVAMVVKQAQIGGGIANVLKALRGHGK